MTMLRDFVSLPTELNALAVKLNVPEVEGMPEITPPLDKFKPSGRLPLSSDQVIADSPLAPSASM